HKLERGESAGRAAVESVPIAGVLSRNDKSVFYRTAELTDRPEIEIVPVPLFGKEDVKGVVKIVAPLSIETIPSLSGTVDDLWVVQVAFSDQINGPLDRFRKGVDLFLQLPQNMFG